MNRVSGVADAPASRFRPTGELIARRDGDWIALDFPATPAEPVEAPPGLLEALDTPATFVGRNRYDYLVEAEGEAAVRALAPDIARLRELEVRGVIVTGRAEDTYDFVSRFFAPGAGVDEDPVTGSAHCTLGPYWQSRLRKAEFLAYQASVRGGVVRVRVEGDRVKLGGQAVTVLRGELA